MSRNGFEVIMMSADGKERADVEREEGCKHISVPMTRKITPFHDLYCLALLIRYFKQIKPDIVHTHTPKAGLLGMLAAKMCGVPIRIHTVAGLPLMVERGLKLRILIFTEKMTYWGAQLVLPNSKSLLQYIQDRRLCPPRKLDVILEGSSNGVDADEFSRDRIDADKLEAIKKTLGYQADKFYLLSIGRIVKDKGIEELVECFQDLKKSDPELRLLLLGSMEQDLDPLSEKTLAFIRTDDAITHIPYSEDVKYYLYLANVLIHASHREGFPNVALQAGAMKTPIICSNIVGNIDIVEDGKTGLLFEVKNKTSMREKIEFARSHPDLINALADNLYHKTMDIFSRKAIQTALFEKYVQLLKEKGLTLPAPFFPVTLA